MADISTEQVGVLLRAAEHAEHAKKAADAAREALDQALLTVAREARVGFKELAAVTGLHTNTIRAGIQRAAGESSIDFEQLELDLGLNGEQDSGTHDSRGRSEAVRASFPAARIHASRDKILGTSKQLSTGERPRQRAPKPDRGLGR